MKAAVRKAYGPPESLSVEELDKPQPKANEVLVKVQATTVNRTDCAVLTGKPYIMRLFTGLSRPKNPIPGTDFAGVVEAIGERVAEFQAGDKVWGFHDEGLGSQAEFLCIAENKNILKMPEGCSFEEAAASIEGAHYAYNFLNKVDIKGLIEQGKFRPLIDRNYPLAQIAEAYTYVASGQKTGNVVIAY